MIRIGAGRIWEMLRLQTSLTRDCFCRELDSSAAMRRFDSYSGCGESGALGAAVDLLGWLGGTAILSRNPGDLRCRTLAYSASHLAKAIGGSSCRIRWWEETCAERGGTITIPRLQ
jgi:hypothetical protein